MSNTDTFIQEVENYFLTLSEKGLMLSSKDYFLITEWMERGLSKEQIYSGFRKAFEEKTKGRIRNIYDCKEYVENSEVRTNRSEPDKIDVVESSNYIDRIISNFDKLMANEKRPNLLKLHKIYKSKVSKLNAVNNNIFEEINRIEKKYFAKFLDYLEEDERLNHKIKIESVVNSSNDYINEESKKKALNIQLKNLIIEEYININPFETDE
ncbi:MAG: hypothetical protein ACR2NW_01485 [Thermodesulfobacteriota bacterium]